MDLKKKKEMRLMHLSCNNDDAAGRGSARQTRLVHIPGRIPPGDPLPEWNGICLRPPLYRYLPTDKTS
jgi:hypothetical protein